MMGPSGSVEPEASRCTFAPTAGVVLESVKLATGGLSAAPVPVTRQTPPSSEVR